MGRCLEKGCVYVVPLMERLALPEKCQAVANAKSSTGRLDLLTRTITDGGASLTGCPRLSGPALCGNLPALFFGLVRPGMRLNQIRFRQGTPSHDEASCRTACKHRLVMASGDLDGLGFSVDLRPQKTRWSDIAPNRTPV